MRSSGRISLLAVTEHYRSRIARQQRQRLFEDFGGLYFFKAEKIFLTIVSQTSLAPHIFMNVDA